MPICPTARIATPPRYIAGQTVQFRGDIWRREGTRRYRWHHQATGTVLMRRGGQLIDDDGEPVEGRTWRKGERDGQGCYMVGLTDGLVVVAHESELSEEVRDGE